MRAVQCSETTAPVRRLCIETDVTGTSATRARADGAQTMIVRVKVTLTEPSTTSLRRYVN